jgi:hypothetical protein
MAQGQSTALPGYQVIYQKFPKPLIIVKLQGGLGNQLFQYAAARCAAGQHEVIYLDHAFLQEHQEPVPDFTVRKFELGIFAGLQALPAGKRTIALFKSQAFVYKTARRLFGKRMKYVQQKGNGLVTLPDTKKSLVYLDGYFQSEKYFKSKREWLLREFNFPRLDPGNTALAERIEHTPDAVAVHIRRGDYLSSAKINAVHGVLPLSYYEEAMGRLQSRYPLTVFFIFCEEMDWAKANFTGSSFHFVEGNRGPESWKDMALMSKCRHHIIANSSFSWWGAWLSAQTGTVFAPERWFDPKQVIFETEDFIPEKWNILAID